MIVREFTTLLGVRRIATFSDCMKYRSLLSIQWDASLPMLHMNMLNPSTATEEDDDPTISRQCVRARLLGFGGLIVSNVNDWRSTDPMALYKVPSPCSEDNDLFINHAASVAGMTICAWGNHGNFRRRADQVYAFLPKPVYALKVSKTGEPWHPLYLPYSLKPFVYDRDVK